MDVAGTLANTTLVQGALGVVAALRLTAALWGREPRGTAAAACADVVVVGAGSAGATLAARLAAARPALRVLLLEAGDDPPIESLYPGLLGYLPNSRWDWNYTADARGAIYRDGRIPLTRGKMLGGSSGVNYMAYVRGGPAQYGAWARAAADPAWARAALLPYFARSERLEDRAVLRSPSAAYHGTAGPVGVTRDPRPQSAKYLQAFREIGQRVVLDINGESPLGYTEPMFTIAQGVRQSSAYAFLRTRRPNLEVVRGALVTRVLFDERRAAVGVRVRVRGGGERTVRAARQVVLAAGALNSPQLLQLSGVGPAGALAALGIPPLVDLPVGRGLMDHTATMLAFATERPQGSAAPGSLDPTRFPVPLILGFATPDDDGSEPAYETENLVIAAGSAGVLQFCAGAFRLRDEFCQRLHDGARGREVLLTFLFPLSARSRGSVKLRSARADDPPLVDLNQYSAAADVDDMVDYVQHFMRISNSSYFRRVGAELVDAAPAECAARPRGSRAYWRCYVRRVALTQFHYGGTCALGAVVDAALRVRGVRRLRVADASVMPELPGGNINAAALVVGERAADLVLRDLPPPPPPAACPPLPDSAECSDLDP